MTEDEQQKETGLEQITNLEEPETKTKAPPEISLEEFMKLGETVDKVRLDDDDVLVHMKDKAHTCEYLANKTNVSYSAMYSRLTRMVIEQTVVKRGKNGIAYYVDARCMR